MSSPIRRTESPILDEHAKRKRDEVEALEKQTSIVPSEQAGTDPEAAPPKKIKPEIESSTSVSKAEVKQIQRNLKTMPLEDSKSSENAEIQSKDMDDVESDPGSNEENIPDKVMEESATPLQTTTDNPQDPESTPSSDIGDQETESANTTIHSVIIADDKNGTELKKTTTEPPSKSASSPGSKLGAGFNNTSIVSPFANVKSSENVFGSSSSTLKGFSATSTSSPFAATENTNVFGGKSSPLSAGFRNTSSVSPFAPTTSTNVFGGDSSKSVFGQSTTSTISSFGVNAGSSADSTAGSVFGAKSIVGSAASTNSPHKSSGFPATLRSTSSETFSTFGAKNTFGKEASFTSGSFIDQDSSHEKADFGSLLSQDTGDHDGDGDQYEGEESFSTGVFSQADQIDVQTGEEDEINIYQTKGKLYADSDKTHTWKERGKGTFKVNVGQHDTKVARLVMRADGVLRLILNVAIFPDMNVVITGEKYIRFIGIEDGKPISFLLKVKDAVVASEVVDAINHASERQARKNHAA
ncbi:hypothetical protein BX616_010190 [Lobosporangium transversale]|uniref:RanBD1 domain-containing protein n=1 Tax=Lobosporangium transversale TaxID=64571 RepID=A0A1Y2GMJ5_9FUNG|nr:hypothetical protein BCR41DRAFT_353306 [Lobosporangium transversale]KAF9912989.1 hypothetical protein BX616_010190 [Lobosporangium transversale]ORZ15989.1 hypothetical protein BCR41DRAFT_353306 [Lobosporangium transversale]|eukprot:XP_021881336.1 hypothetical protein BCR41DRAFT_353306 [Lobosporangium transversale]